MSDSKRGFVKQRQGPLREQYRTTPEAACITDGAGTIQNGRCDPFHTDQSTALLATKMPSISAPTSMVICILREHRGVFQKINQKIGLISRAPATLLSGQQARRRRRTPRNP